MMMMKDAMRKWVKTRGWGIMAYLACMLIQPPGCLLSQPPLVAPEGPVAPHGLEEIHRPLSVVSRLYQSAVRAGKPVAGDFGVREHFLRELEGKWHLVPTLNTVDRLDQLEPGCLVRFKCMVQSHFNPEFYVGQVYTGEGDALTTKYRDSLPPDVDEIPDVNDLKVARAMWERLPVKCVELPGETPWAKQQYAELAPAPSDLQLRDAAHVGVNSASPRKRALGSAGQEETQDLSDKTQDLSEGQGVQSPSLRRRTFLRGVRSADTDTETEQAVKPSADLGEAAAGEAAATAVDGGSGGEVDVEGEREEERGDGGRGEEEVEEEEAEEEESDVLEGRRKGPRVKDNILITAGGAKLVFDAAR